MEQTSTPATPDPAPPPTGEVEPDFDRWIETTQATTPANAEPVPPVEPAPAEGAAAAEEPLAPVEEPDPDPASEAGKTLAKHKRSLQARIDQATAKQRDAERRAEALEQEIAALKTPRTPAPGTQAPLAPGDTYVTPAEDPEPTIEDFQDQDDPYMAHAKAAARWAARDETRKQKFDEAHATAAARARIDAETAARQTEQVVADHARRLDAFRATHPDFDARLASSTAVTTRAISEEIAHSEHGPAIVQHFLDHPEDSHRIAALSEGRQRYEIGRLAARFDTAPSSGPVSSVPPISSAPPPPKPVGASASALARDPAALSTDEYIESMNAEEQRRHRR